MLAGLAFAYLAWQGITTAMRAHRAVSTKYQPEVW